MTTTEKFNRALMNWRAEEAEFKANPTPERLAKLKKASDLHVAAGQELLREKRRNSLKAN